MQHQYKMLVSLYIRNSCTGFQDLLLPVNLGPRVDKHSLVTGPIVYYTFWSTGYLELEFTWNWNFEQWNQLVWERLGQNSAN